MKYIKLPIVFSVRCTPDECRRLLDDYVDNGSRLVRFYNEDIRDMTFDHFVTRNPCGKIVSYDVDDIGYTLTIEYNEDFDPLFDDYKHGKEDLLCHPTIIISNGRNNPASSIIGWMSIFKHSDLIPNMTYDGIHEEYRCVKE